MLSIIIPAYNEEQIINTTSQVIHTLMRENDIKYEIIFVDDGSRDNTWIEVAELTRTNIHIKGIRFSRNFGKEAAIRAGLSEASGNCAVVIDCDLQHPPEKIVEMA